MSCACCDIFLSYENVKFTTLKIVTLTITQLPFFLPDRPPLKFSRYGPVDFLHVFNIFLMILWPGNNGREEKITF